ARGSRCGRGPPARRGGGRAGGGRCSKIDRACKKIHMRTLTPSPPLPRKRGREQTESADRSVHSTRTASSASASPPSRKGGATRASLPPERIPFHRGNGVSGGLARRERLGREIVDRDRGGDRVGGGAQLV